jgi:hypothetical protein
MNNHLQAERELRQGCAKIDDQVRRSESNSRDNFLRKAGDSIT